MGLEIISIFLCGRYRCGCCSRCGFFYLARERDGGGRELWPIYIQKLECGRAVERKRKHSLLIEPETALVPLEYTLLAVVVITAYIYTLPTWTAFASDTVPPFKPINTYAGTSKVRPNYRKADRMTH